MPDVLLYHVPPSFYSQIARLGLQELGVAFEAQLVGPGPPTFETYRPWYMKLNPMGTVPTLVHGDQVVPDSDAILRYAVEHLSTVRRIPEDEVERAQMEEWITALRELPMRDLSYGAPDKRKMGHRVNRLRARNLKWRAAKHPELAERYAHKLRDIEAFAESAIDEAAFAGHVGRVHALLDRLDTHLVDRTWLVGSAYSLADTVWTVGVARFVMLHLDPLEGRPALAAWYGRVKTRPSFAAANVWERFDALAIAAVLGRRFRIHLSVFAIAIAAGIGLALWALQ